MSELFSGLKIEHSAFIRLDGDNFSKVCDELVLKSPTMRGF
ncbi:MAG: hypothetical protein V3T58_04945 [Candidatus Hydrothermarchaeales archaeon]